MEEPTPQRNENESNDCSISSKGSEDKVTLTNSNAATHNGNHQRPSISKLNNPSPTKTKEATIASTTGTRVKRKSRSTRKRLNAMMNNASLHFSDTDSEGELIIINNHVRNPSPGMYPTQHHQQNQQAPVISVTVEESEDIVKQDINPNHLITNDTNHQRSRRNSFVDNLTDVDEIYASEPENERNGDSGNKLKVVEKNCHGDTDLEDLSNDEGEIEATIYVAPRSDILCDLHGGTMTTKEGDGPFSIEIRNQMSCEEACSSGAHQDAPDIVILPNTDSEDMDVSDEDEACEAACSQREFLEDLDVLAASQIVMTNSNKTDNTLNVKEPTEDAISDCHTDVEDID